MRIINAKTQLGYLVSQAAKFGLAVPYLSCVYDLLLLRNSTFAAQSGESTWAHLSVINLLAQEMPLRLSTVVD